MKINETRKMKKLNELLLGREPIEVERPRKNFGLDDMHISRYAFEKAYKYARLALQINRTSIEVGGFLTLPIDAKDRIARDAYLARDQRVTSVSYNVNAEDVRKAGKELHDQGQKIVGWWHSHGTLTAFPSDIDKENQRVLLNQIAPSNYIVIPQEKKYTGIQTKLEGDELVFWEDGTEFRLKLKEANERIAADSLRIISEKRVGFCYSFIVNYNRWLAERRPYCEIATRDLCMSCLEARDANDKAGYKVFDLGEFELDEGELKSDLNERVFNPRPQVKKEYFLPENFEAQRAAGTLTAPALRPDYTKLYTPKKKKIKGKETQTKTPGFFGGLFPEDEDLDDMNEDGGKK